MNPTKQSLSVAYKGEPERGIPAVIMSNDNLVKITIDCARNYGNCTKIAGEICNSFNNHDKLVEALKTCQRILKDKQAYHAVIGNDVNFSLGMMIEIALKQAESE